jgi:hypothetical protein
LRPAETIIPSPKPATPAIKADVPPLPIVIFRPIVRALVSVMLNSPFPMTIKPVPRAEVPKAGDVRPAFRAACPSVYLCAEGKRKSLGLRRAGPQTLHPFVFGRPISHSQYDDDLVRQD